MRWQLNLVILLIVNNGYAQPLPSFRALRYDENYAVLKQDTAPAFYRKLKYAALSADRNTYLSVGGEARLQYTYYKNDQWSDAPDATHSDVLSRYLLHGDLHVGKSYRLFTQLQSSLAIKKLAPAPVDDNSLELHQAFIDWQTPAAGKSSLTVRIGRQELLYGSQRLISVREGPNNRQSFDGLKIMYQGNSLRTDLFYSHYVRTRKGFFNDRPSANTRLWGLYIVQNNIAPLINADIYYLGLYKQQAAFDDGTGKEVRHSIGTRIWHNGEKFKYDAEAVYQFGRFNEKKIRAYTASLNTSYTFNSHRLKPKIGLKSELISGDRAYNDNKLQTFNPLFPRGGYFGLAALIGPENLAGLHPSWSFNAWEALNISFDYDIIWRYSSNDGLYAPNNRLIYSGRNTAQKLIGHQYSMIANYAFNRYLAFSAVFTWFNAGPYLKAATPGRDVRFAGLTTQAKF